MQGNLLSIAELVIAHGIQLLFPYTKKVGFTNLLMASM